ncbi:MAG: hypothetical protein L0G94_10225, partial [Brachybacterium sp.]|uniref:hypothetical protein n=1 Tax=Brachybacterium sp. TaxID=1891286 RepID=UPI002648659F
NTPTVYARRARHARDAAQTIAYSTRHFTRADDVRAARLTDYATRCADLAHLAAGRQDTIRARTAGDHADDTRAAWRIVRFDRERRAGLRGLPAGGMVPTAQRVPMEQQ